MKYEVEFFICYSNDFVVIRHAVVMLKNSLFR